MFEFPKQLDDNGFRMFQYYTIDKIVSKSCRLKDLSPILSGIFSSGVDPSFCTLVLAKNMTKMSLCNMEMLSSCRWLSRGTFSIFQSYASVEQQFVCIEACQTKFFLKTVQKSAKKTKSISSPKKVTKQPEKNRISAYKIEQPKNVCILYMYHGMDGGWWQQILHFWLGTFTKI